MDFTLPCSSFLQIKCNNNPGQTGESTFSLHSKIAQLSLIAYFATDGFLPFNTRAMTEITVLPAI